MNQVFDSTHKENIKKTREFITAIVDTKKLRVCENIPLRGNRDNTKNHPEVLIILVELLQHRVDGVDKNLENQPQNA